MAADDAENQTGLWRCICRQDFKRHNLCCAPMGGLQVNPWCAALVMSLQEPAGTQAPSVTRLQTRKTKFGMRGRQVVADIFRIGKKFGRHDGADRMAAVIFGASIALPIPEKAGHGIC
jgi:hypothetical protein